ncbi:insulinase family protein [Vibrio sp. 404]|uniref:Insulinase family protein n=2 Tax=Vibrio marinisediminis TaxID=2758441 RepID=A0A7W2FTN4_9VIBR|nr:insulinase family protein [Vibrio marinisediminis]
MKTIPILIAACIALSGCQPQTTITSDTELSVREDMIQGELDNGMRYILVENNRPKDRVSLQLIVHAGSLDEAEDQKGIAHLVEHMAFNGTEQFPANTLIEHQEALGMVFGRDVNAMTEYYTTSYFLHLPNNSDKMLDEGFNMLAQQASALVFEQYELEKERPVVEEEWRSGRNMMARIGSANREILLKDSRFGDREPIGDMELVRHVDASRIEAFWQDWYHPNNMTMIVVGATNKAEVEKKLTRFFAHLPAKELPKRPELSVPLDNQLRIEVIADSEITTEVLSFNFREQEAQPHTESELRNQLLNEMTMQVLNKRLREQYQVESEHVSKMMMMSRPIATDYRNNRLMVLLTGNDYLATVDEAFEQLSRFAEHGFAEGDLTSVRQSIVSRYTQMADSLRTTTNRRVMMSIFNRLRSQSPITDSDQLAATVKKLTDDITLQELNTHLDGLIEQLSPLVIAQIKPENQSKLPTVDQLQQAWNHAKANPPAATLPVTTNKPLMESIPAAAEIVSHQEKDGVQSWTLANGATVWFEYSDETPNQLLVDYRGWGGSQHLPKELRRAALQLRQMSKFGYGGFNSDQLSMLNATYPNRIMAFVNQDSHGFIGASDASSLENWLQNLHLQITQPQVDAQLWAATQQLLERGIENRMTSSSGQFNSAIDAIRYVNNPELLSLTKAELHQIDVEDLLQAWERLFSSAKNHQLIVVGNAKPDQVISLAQRYIGSLPSESSFPPIKLPKLGSGEHDVHVAAGEEPMGVTSLMFNQDLTYSIEREDEAYLLSRILSNRLRESLREASGGVYSVRFGIRLDRDRDQAYGLVSYSHDPIRAKELKAKAMVELDNLLTKGVEQEELNEVVTQTKHALQADNITDRQRMSYLKAAVQYGDSFTAVTDYLAWIDSVEPQNLNDLAKKVLITNNWIDASLVPAEKETTTKQ